MTSTGRMRRARCRSHIDGRAYEIDLSEDNAARLRESLASFVAAARKSGGSRGGRSPGTEDDRELGPAAAAAGPGADRGDPGVGRQERLGRAADRPAVRPDDQYATALRLGTAEAEQVLRRFTRGGPKHPTYAGPGRARPGGAHHLRLRLPRRPELRREIHDGLQVVENWNSANKRIFYGKDGDLTGPDPMTLR